MRPREWEHVIRALVLLGCEVLRETEENVIVMRGVPVIYPIPRRPLTVRFQYDLITTLGFAEPEYLSALERSRS